MIFIGTILTFMSLVISALTYKSLACLFIFQGAGLGVSQAIALPLTMSLPSQWFLKRRGMATGLAVSGTGIGGGTRFFGLWYPGQPLMTIGTAVSSLLLQVMLPPLGYRASLLIYAGGNFTLCAVAFLLLKTRDPCPDREKVKRGLPKGIWRDRVTYS